VGDFQKLNLNLALNCLNFLSVRDGFKIDEKSLQNTLLNLSFPGRFEVFSLKNSSKKIIFDGAHNFQKISTFLDSLKKEFPKQRFNFVVGLKKGKDYKRFLRKIVNFEGVQKVYLTKINQEKNPSVESISILEMKNYLAKILEKSSVEKQKIKILSVEKIEDILEKEIPEEENNLAIVGSLYFYNSLEI
jgi:folylpolyglutamate synthase/dihydropteroate synthase